MTTFIKAVLFALNFSCVPSMAANKTISEGVPSTFKGIYVDSATARVYFSTTGYGGGIAAVGIVTSSNVVISNPTSANNVVIYSTGSVVAGGILGPSYWTLTGTNISNNNSGNVGIGTTNPLQRLDVVTGGKIGFNGLPAISQNGIINYAWSQGGGGSWRVINGAGSTELVTVLDTGKVGIGTNNPLDSQGYGGPTVTDLAGPIYVRAGAGATGHFVAMGQVGAETRIISNVGALRFFSNSITSLYLGANQQVGIGTTNPLTTLHVQPGPVMIGDGVGGAGNQICTGLTLPATSIDGAIESAGCVVVLSMSGTGSTATLQFTSTTTALVNVAYGVLTNTTAPGAIGNVCVSGLAFENCSSGAAGNTSCTGSTRCQVDGGGIPSSCGGNNAGVMISACTLGNVWALWP